ncbi:MAG: signal peptidase II [Acidimicrobiales bacterium]
MQGVDPRMLAAGIAAAVVICDQLTKTWALHHAVLDRHVIGPLYLTLVFNRGAAFGLGAGVGPIVEAVVVCLVVAIVAFGRRAGRRRSRVLGVGLGLLVGGAMGNLVDRAIRHEHGAVIDFVQAARVGNRDYWPVFNLADASVVLGAISLALVLSRRNSQ